MKSKKARSLFLLIKISFIITLLSWSVAIYRNVFDLIGGLEEIAYAVLTLFFAMVGTILVPVIYFEALKRTNLPRVHLLYIVLFSTGVLLFPIFIFDIIH